MSPAFQRGNILYQQGRYDRAAAEFRQSLADDPDDPFSHALLALCLIPTEQKAESLHEADEAVRLAPEIAFCHFARGHALLAGGQAKEAEEAAREAISLSPDEADFRSLLASVEMHRRRWAEALEAADAGLALDPTHDVCLNLRGMALVQLGRKDEAVQALGESLADDPENAWTHANQGWAYLHQGQVDKALTHFREALRLDPELEWARMGTIEALKARHFLYRWMLAFFLWIGRKSSAAQWAIILGFVFGRMLLRDLAQAYPALGPLISPVLVLTFGFLLMSWVASPLFNLLLQFNKFGRMALSREQKVESSCVGGCFILAAAFAALNFATGLFPSPAPAGLIDWWKIFLECSMLYFGLLVLPLAMTFHQRAGRPRWIATTYTFVVALLALPAYSVILFKTASPFAAHPNEALDFFNYFIWGCVLSTWAANFLGSRFAR